MLYKTPSLIYGDVENCEVQLIALRREQPHDVTYETVFIGYIKCSVDLEDRGHLLERHRVSPFLKYRFSPPYFHGKILIKFCVIDPGLS